MAKAALKALETELDDLRDYASDDEFHFRDDENGFDKVCAPPARCRAAMQHCGSSS
jgi:hypothetical protein